MKNTFPSFDLGIDHLFPSEPEGKKQKKEEQQRLLVIWTTSSKGFKRRQQNMQQNNKILKVTFCFFFLNVQ